MGGTRAIRCGRPRLRRNQVCKATARDPAELAEEAERVVRSAKANRAPDQPPKTTNECRFRARARVCVCGDGGGGGGGDVLPR